MVQREIKEGWWTVKWPDQDGYDLVEFVRITQGGGHAAWGYRHKVTEDPSPISEMVAEGPINAIPVHIVEDIQQLIQETRDFGTTAFYRGHRRFEWELIPTVFRKSCEGNENSMLNDFRIHTPVRYSSSPDEQDLCNWLSLAQHYGLPTRLLDWTRSPLVAAYFATAPNDADDGRPGAIWALNPKKLNNMTTDGQGIFCFSMDNKEVEELVKPAFDDESTSPREIVAVVPTEQDMRFFAQQSAFTLHGHALPLQEWRAALIPDREEHRQLMQCAIIQPKAKLQIRDDLARLGIHEASLFPDLSNLAHYIARDKRHWKQ